MTALSLIPNAKVPIVEGKPLTREWYKYLFDNYTALHEAGHPLVAANVAFTPSGTIGATNVQAAIQELDAETQAQFAKSRSVLILNGLSVTTPAAGYVPSTLLWGGGPLNPLGMYDIATGIITLKETGLYQFGGTLRCNHPSTAYEGEFGVAIEIVTGTPEGRNLFRPLIVNWNVNEVLFVPFLATYQGSAGDQFKFTAYSANGVGCSVGGGNVENSMIMVTRIG
jgi:hypothetical protein